jgi:hypothetical protein
MVQACNPHTQEAKAGRSWVGGQCDWIAKPQKSRNNMVYESNSADPLALGFICYEINL